jgi:Flp pilus assembly protein CpaB
VIRLRRPRSPATAVRRVAAALLVVVAAVLALRPSAAPVRATAGATVPVAVAARDLPAGTELRSADLRAVAYPRGLAPGGAYPAAERLSGRVLASGVRAGEAVTDVRLVGAGLTALLEPGQVAAPVRPADLAVTALVRAGDRVDVLATPPDAAQAEVISEAALVLAAPSRRSGGRDLGSVAEADPGGLLVLAVDGPTAARLAAAAAGATLTVTLTAP